MPGERVQTGPRRERPHFDGEVGRATYQGVQLVVVVHTEHCQSGTARGEEEERGEEDMGRGWKQNAVKEERRGKGRKRMG